MLGMAYIRGLEVRDILLLFQLQPVARSPTFPDLRYDIVHDLAAAEENLIEDLQGPHRAQGAFRISARRPSSRAEEVECLGACTNAPMAQDRQGFTLPKTDGRRSAAMIGRHGRRAAPACCRGRRKRALCSEPLSGLVQPD